MVWDVVFTRVLSMVTCHKLLRNVKKIGLEELGSFLRRTLVLSAHDGLSRYEHYFLSSFPG